MHKKGDIHWPAKAKEAFKLMKQLTAELPMLTAPMEKEELIVYLVAAKKMTSRVSIKGQILADFIVERLEEDSSDTLMEVEEELLEPWILFMDGSSCTDGSGAGLILTNPKGVEFTYALRFRFDATNNEAEYEALIAELRIEKQMGEVDMIRYLEKVRTLTNSFKAFSIKQIPKSENKKADALSKIAFTSFAYLSKQVLVEELKEKSISEVEILAAVEEEGDTWMTPIFKYLEREPYQQMRRKQGHNGDTPFSLTYGTEAVIPVEIGMPTLRTAEVDLVQKNKALEINLDLLEEKRKEAAILVVSAVAGTVSKVPSVHVTATAEKGSAKGDILKKDIWLIIFSLIIRTKASETSKAKGLWAATSVKTQPSLPWDVFIPLAEPFCVVAVTCTEGTFDTVPAIADTTTALSVTFASASIVDPISIDEYEVTCTDDQLFTIENVVDENANPFLNVDDAKLNIP
nr:reverse transcriptase domain-containing protein [Tanacetum cinerariifolium]